MAPWAQQFRDVATTFLPDRLRTIVERGLLKAFAVALTIVVVLPPALVLLAAFWLHLLGKIDWTFVQDARQSYIQFVERGFSLEELATRGNARLDYLQTFEFDLNRKLLPNKVLHLSLNPYQKTTLIFRRIAFTADAPECTLPESDLKLVDVSLGNQLVRTLKTDANVNISIGKQWWSAHATSFGDDPLDQLSFSLSDAVRQLKCGSVHVEGTVEVFKDDLQHAS